MDSLATDRQVLDGIEAVSGIVDGIKVHKGDSTTGNDRQLFETRVGLDNGKKLIVGNIDRKVEYE